MTWAELHGALRGRGLVRADDALQADAAVGLVSGIAYDSRAVKAGTVFVALRGQHVDGTMFARQAIDNGASAVVLASVVWQAANRDQMLATREESRRRMREQGIEMLPLSQVADPDRYRKLYEMWIESEKDIPTTVPSRDLSPEEWKRFWFTNPAIREDHMWVAIQDGHVAGI